MCPSLFAYIHAKFYGTAWLYTFQYFPCSISMQFSQNTHKRHKFLFIIPRLVNTVTLHMWWSHYNLAHHPNANKKYHSRWGEIHRQSALNPSTSREVNGRRLKNTSVPWITLTSAQRHSSKIYVSWNLALFLLLLWLHSDINKRISSVMIRDVRTCVRCSVWYLRNHSHFPKSLKSLIFRDGIISRKMILSADSVHTMRKRGFLNINYLYRWITK